MSTTTPVITAPKQLDQKNSIGQKIGAFISTALKCVGIFLGVITIIPALIYVYKNHTAESSKVNQAAIEASQQAAREATHKNFEEAAQLEEQAAPKPPNAPVPQTPPSTETAASIATMKKIALVVGGAVAVGFAYQYSDLLSAFLPSALNYAQETLGNLAGMATVLSNISSAVPTR